MRRLQSVDVLRTFAIFAVIAIHTTPFASHFSDIGRTLNLATVINQAARFAVPLFFVLSGYFWSKNITDQKQLLENTKKLVKRTAFLFIVWSVIYLLPMNVIDSFSSGGPISVAYGNVINVVNNPLATLLEGTKLHLWFLMGLLCSILISFVFLRLKLRRSLAAFAIALYVIGLAGKAYRDTPWGIHADFNFRDGPFFPLIFFVTGYFLQQRKPSDAWFPIGLLITVCGIFLHFTEIFILNKNWGTTMGQDYVIGTYFFGVGVALIALSNTRHLQFPRIALIGPFVPGIYVSHMIFFDLLKPLDQKFGGSGIWDLTYEVSVFVLAYVLTRILATFNFTRKLVM